MEGSVLQIHPFAGFEEPVLYLDRYRDPRDIAQEYILKKLKDIDPLKPPEKPFPYPKVFTPGVKDMASWLRIKEIRTRLGRGKVAEIRQDEYE